MVIVDNFYHCLSVILQYFSVNLLAEISQAVISGYKYHAKAFHKYGMLSVLDCFERGDAETFYFHAFCHYVPQMIQKLYQAHGLGLRVMTMEGFKHKHFTSKHAVRNRTNGKGM